jgi:hypothetical protein
MLNPEKAITAEAQSTTEIHREEKTLIVSKPFKDVIGPITMIRRTDLSRHHMYRAETKREAAASLFHCNRPTP